MYESILKNTTSNILFNDLKESILETLWPTRCAICDKPGLLVCKACQKKIPYIDWWNACKRCGSPYGKIQCCECNFTMLHDKGITALPYTRCASVVHMSREAGRIITVYKDAGEQRLSAYIAQEIFNYLSPSWLYFVQGITYIPDSPKAFNRRGFDHMELIAKEFGLLCNKPVIPLFERPKSHDQRKLNSLERLANMQASLILKKSHHKIPQNIILLDDTTTTGATLVAASLTLKAAGAQRIYCATYARS